MGRAPPPGIANHVWFVPIALVPFFILEDQRIRGTAVFGAVALALFSPGQLDAVIMEPVSPLPVGSLQAATIANTIGASGALVVLVVLFARQSVHAEAQLERELERADGLLLNVLPVSIAERLKSGETALADHHADATVLFADLVGFTRLARSMPPTLLVEILGELFTAFDALTATLKIEKIKTIGDAYMVAAGVPTARDDHAEAVAELALGMLHAANETAERRSVDLSLRIGIHSGELVAGVIGQDKFSYDLWGDTVNIASRLEAHGEPGRIQMSASTRALLSEAFVCQRRGQVQLKGGAELEAWWLVDRRGLG